MTPRAEVILLILLCLVGFGLRFYKLGEWSFWVDEVFTVSFREDGFNYNLFRQSLATTLIQTTVTWLGTNEWTARLVPAWIGILSIPLLYFPVKRIFGPRVALFSSLLLALSPWHLYWSQNARFYSLLLLFYSLGLLLFFIGLEEDRPWILLFSLLFFGLAARERLLALFFIPVIVSYLLLLKVLPIPKPKGLKVRNLAFFFLPGFVLGLLFAAPYLRDLRGWFAAFVPDSANPLWLVAVVVYYVGLPVVCLGVFGALYSFICKTEPRKALFFFLGATIPLLANVAITPFHYTASRYVFVSLTSWILLASLFVGVLFAELRGNARVIALGVAVLLASAYLSEDLLYFRYQNGNRDDWKGAFEYVKANRGADDLVVSTNAMVGSYYMGEKIPRVDVLREPLKLSEYGQVWIVADLSIESDFPELLPWLADQTQQVANFDVHANARNFKMRVYLYRPVQSSQP
jgi:hypothetical protein